MLIPLWAMLMTRNASDGIRWISQAVGQWFKWNLAGAWLFRPGLFVERKLLYFSLSLSVALTLLYYLHQFYVRLQHDQLTESLNSFDKVSLLKWCIHLEQM